MMRYAAIFLATALGAMGCSATANTGGGGGGGGGGGDAGNGGGGDTGSTARDTGSTNRDTGSAARDTGTTARDTGNGGGGGQFGQCGETVARAACMCAQNDVACQNRALNMSMTCVQCLGDNQLTCCPTQAQAIQTCAETSMCQDQACLQSRCASQINALQTCYQSTLMREAQTGTGACINGYIACLGDVATMGCP